ncbi:DUF6232 family protein [Pseudomonas denitrificans (nom. rej.)]|uniref:QacE n=1 Tax=Pseudomonas denitrificans TaxID=43306 RepID=A0A9X7N3V4_PSEDE|nr:DUF6232 family protein [Pseudomonas denitrificans (nom. rej.)]QEY74667.1 QacE [Pseudomonas denitrificans (nom. rej.)]
MSTDEKLFLDQNGVSISNSRFIVNKQTYAMNGVTSVKQAENKPSRLGPIICALAGIIALTNGKLVIGGAIVAIAIVWLTLQKSIFLVILHTASGEVQALKSTDRKFIDSVINALNDSIVHRG